MRKFLLSTSALAGAALLSSAAIADVNISGTVEWEMISGDTDNAATDGTSMNMADEINIDFTNKTDSGLTITFNADLNAGTGGVDDNSMSISGGFGKLTVGNTDGVADAMAFDGKDLVAEEHGMSATLDTDNTIAQDTGAQLDGNINKVTYMLPAMGGFSAGVSFEDSGANTSTDTTSFGAQYSMEANGAAVTIGYTSETEENATEDKDARTIGAKVVMNGISFIANQMNYEENGEDQTGNSFGVAYTLPSGLSLGYATVTVEDDGATQTGEEFTANHYEAAYSIASGLSAVVTVSDYDYKVGTGSGASAKTADSGTISSFMLKAAF
jgi:outer membrane protein OmpU